MSSSNPSGKDQKDRLVELEEQMLYLVEVPDSIRYLESRLEEISDKTNMIDVVAGRVEGFPIQELMTRVDALETTINIGRTNYKRNSYSKAELQCTNAYTKEVESCLPSDANINNVAKLSSWTNGSIIQEQ
uniref:Uncharacterized protein n=1 Tax=Cucumis melo TaxID=3656 RepID=A0A9I9EHE8_CUCME